MHPTLALLTTLPLLATAHYSLEYPPVRGSNEDQLTQFPCGGFNTPSSTRASWPINGGPVQVKLGHAQTRFKVLMALGDNPGDNFNITVRDTFVVEGLGDFCVGGLDVPEGVNVSEGMKATIQVVSNGDPSGGLYTCADVTLTTQTLSETEYNQHCKNATNIKITEQNIMSNPNETTTDSGEGTHTGDHAEHSATPSAQPGLAGHTTAATWLMAVVGVAGFALCL